jgi:5-methyltetrahydrofolate--homocysteine methyltransferase
MRWERLFESNDVILFDGANGTEYQRRGLPPGAAPESLVLTDPNLVKQVHREYLHAGSQVITSNTFGGNRKRLAAAGLETHLVEINRQAVELARAAGASLVAGSMGPLGTFIEPYGDVSKDEAYALFQEQAELLKQAGVDLVVIETMMSLEEALIALQAVRETGVRSVGVTLTFDLTPEGPRTAFGEAPSLAARRLLEAGAMFVGSNCGKGLEVMRAVASDMIRCADPARVLLQPNAGLPTVVAGLLRYPETPEQYGTFVREMARLGIRLFGGCCGTTAEHIAHGKSTLRMRTSL